MGACHCSSARDPDINDDEEGVRVDRERRRMEKKVQKLEKKGGGSKVIGGKEKKSLKQLRPDAAKMAMYLTTDQLEQSIQSKVSNGGGRERVGNVLSPLSLNLSDAAPPQPDSDNNKGTGNHQQMNKNNLTLGSHQSSNGDSGNSDITLTESAASAMLRAANDGSMMAGSFTEGGQFLSPDNESSLNEIIDRINKENPLQGSAPNTAPSSPLTTAINSSALSTTPLKALAGFSLRLDTVTEAAHEMSTPRIESGRLVNVNDGALNGKGIVEGKVDYPQPLSDSHRKRSEQQNTALNIHYDPSPSPSPPPLTNNSLLKAINQQNNDIDHSSSPPTHPSHHDQKSGADTISITKPALALRSSDQLFALSLINGGRASLNEDGDDDHSYEYSDDDQSPRILKNPFYDTSPSSSPLTLPFNDQINHAIILTNAHDSSVLSSTLTLTNTDTNHNNNNNNNTDASHPPSIVSPNRRSSIAHFLAPDSRIRSRSTDDLAVSQSFDNKGGGEEERIKNIIDDHDDNSSQLSSIIPLSDDIIIIPGYEHQQAEAPSLPRASSHPSLPLIKTLKKHPHLSPTLRPVRIASALIHQSSIEMIDHHTNNKQAPPKLNRHLTINPSSSHPSLASRHRRNLSDSHSINPLNQQNDNGNLDHHEGAMDDMLMKGGANLSVSLLAYPSQSADTDKPMIDRPISFPHNSSSPHSSHDRMPFPFLPPSRSRSKRTILRLLTIARSSIPHSKLKEFDRLFRSVTHRPDLKGGINFYQFQLHFVDYFDKISDYLGTFLYHDCLHPNHKGLLLYPSLLLGIYLWNEGTKFDRLKLLFQTLDQDNDGYLSKTEIKRFVKLVSAKSIRTILALKNALLQPNDQRGKNGQSSMDTNNRNNHDNNNSSSPLSYFRDRSSTDVDTLFDPSPATRSFTAASRNQSHQRIQSEMDDRLSNYLEIFGGDIDPNEEMDHFEDDLFVVMEELFAKFDINFDGRINFEDWLRVADYYPTVNDFIKLFDWKPSAFEI